VSRAAAIADGDATNPLDHPNLPGTMAGLENMIAAEYCARVI